MQPRRDPPCAPPRARLALLLAALTSACSGSDVTTPAGPSEPVRLASAQSMAHQEEPSLVVLPGGRLVAAWKEMPSPASVGALGFGWSDDSGARWRTGLLPAPPGGGGQSDPWLAVDGQGSVYAASYVQCSIAVARSTDGGETWSGLTQVPVASGCADKPSLVGLAEGGVLLTYHVLGEAGRGRIEWVESSDGATWPTPGIVAEDAAADRLAPVAARVAGARMLVAWWSFGSEDVEVSLSDDHGETWSAPRKLNDTGALIDARVPGRNPTRPPFPSLAASGDVVLVAWPEFNGSDWDVVTSASGDGGTTWTAPAPLPGGRDGDQWMVAVAAGADGAFQAAWYAVSGAETVIRTASSADGGASWAGIRERGEVAGAGPVRLGDYLSAALGPDGGAFLAWTGVRGASLQVFAAPAAIFEQR